MFSGDQSGLEGIGWEAETQGCQCHRKAGHKADLLHLLPLHLMRCVILGKLFNWTKRSSPPLKG